MGAFQVSMKSETQINFPHFLTRSESRLHLAHLQRGSAAESTLPMNPEMDLNDDGYAADPHDDTFADAAARMTDDDWDADNAWLASAGWGEM